MHENATYTVVRVSWVTRMAARSIRIAVNAGFIALGMVMNWPALVVIAGACAIWNALRIAGYARAHLLGVPAQTFAY